MSTELRVIQRPRGAGKTHDLVDAIIDHLAEQAWSSDEPPRLQAVVIVRDGRRNLGSPEWDRLLEYRNRRQVITLSASALDHARGARDVPWFADDFEHFPQGLQSVLVAARVQRAPFLYATTSCHHVVSTTAADHEESETGWVCEDCRMPDPHQGDLL